MLIIFNAVCTRSIIPSPCLCLCLYVPVCIQRLAVGGCEVAAGTTRSLHGDYLSSLSSDDTLPVCRCSSDRHWLGVSVNTLPPSFVHFTHRGLSRNCCPTAARATKRDDRNQRQRETVSLTALYRVIPVYYNFSLISKSTTYSERL